MTLCRRAGIAMATWPSAVDIPPVIKIDPAEEDDWSGEVDEATLDLVEIIQAIEEGRLS